MITEKVPDYYTTLVKVVEICQTEKVPALFVVNAPGAPTYKDMVKAIASVPDVKVLSIGTKESPEYKIEL